MTDNIHSVLARWCRPALVLTLTLPLAAHADTGTVTNYGFTGAYDPSAWTPSFTSVGGGGTASAYISGDSAYLDAAVPSRQRTQAANFTATAVASGPVSFTWDFTVTRPNDRVFTGFGYTLNGIFTRVISNAGGAIQSGRASFNVLAGDVFGWRLNAVGLFTGATTASAVIRELTAPTTCVPATCPTPPMPGAPGPLPLLGLGVAYRASRTIRRKIAHRSTSAGEEK
jgi:hypothetical protein